MWMTRVSITHPVFATMVMVGLTVLGLFSYARLGVEPMPDVSPPGVQIWVNYPGASPEQVENDLAKPIESAVNTVAGVKRILSRSDEGRSLTWVEFRYEVDMDRAMQEVRDKLAQIRATFPRDAKDPVVQRAGGENDQPVASFALMGNGKTPRELTLLAEQVVQKGFERVKGVGRVDLGGNTTRQIQVRVDPAKLTAFGLSVDTVVQALRTANISVPVGTIHNDTSESIIRVDGRLTLAGTVRTDHRRAQKWRPDPAIAGRDGSRRRARAAIAVARQRPARHRHIGLQGTGRQHRRGRPRAEVRGREYPQAASAWDGVEVHVGDGRLRRAVGGQRQDDDRRGRPADGRHRVPVPGFLAQHRHHRADAADLGHRDFHRHLCARLHAELHDADGAVAMHRTADRRCHRGAREHRAPHPHGQGPLHRCARGNRRDRPGGARHDAFDRRGFRADRVHGRHRRQVLLPVRHHGGGRRAVVAVRQLHARPDALGRLARPTGGCAWPARRGADPACLRARHGQGPWRLRPAAALGARLIGRARWRSPRRAS